MPHATFRCTIYADYEKIWETLMDELENPHRYNPGITSAAVVEYFNGGVLRSVGVPDADVKERVEFSKGDGLIRSTLLGHPQLVGSIEKSLKRPDTSGGPHVLNCEIDWESLDENIDHMLRRNVEAFIMNGLNQVKIESEASQQKG